MKNFGNKIFIFVAMVSVLWSCHDEYVLPPLPQEQFIHISHTYVPDLPGQLIDSLVQCITLANYDRVLLGGDLVGSTSLELSTLQKADSIFDLKASKTLWSIGNHDYDNPALVESYIGKPLFYSQYYKGITFLVLDTQDSLSNFVGDQLQLIKNVTDTISESGHLIVMTHKLVWMDGNPVLAAQADSVANGPLGDCFWCINPNRWYQDVYPELLEVKNRGINVICLGGDLGYNTQEFTYETPEGILYLAGGLCSGCAVNKVIVFDYDPDTRSLSHSFRLLTEMAK